MIKGIHDICTDNIILNNERLKPSLLILQRRQECQLLPLWLNIVLDVPARAIRNQNQPINHWIKGIHIGKEVKLFPLADDMIL